MATLWLVVLLGYALIITFIAVDMYKTLKKYNIKYNGYKFIVRDAKGKFVKITASFWDLLRLK